jgi:hypothetical protein
MRCCARLFECHAAPDKDYVNAFAIAKLWNGMPRICWHTIFICGEPQWYGKPLK